jgi:hypothetical protein
LADFPMRLLLSVVLPLAVQLLGFGLVFAVSRGSGSFVGLLALGLAVLAVPLTTLVTWARARRLPPAPTGRLLVTGLLFALTWPLLLLLLRAIEPSL